MLIQNECLNKNIKSTPLENFVIMTRKGNMYSFKEKVKYVEKFPELDNREGYIVRMQRKCSEKDVIIKEFAIVMTPKGIFVTGFVQYARISSKGVASYRKAMGLEALKTPEDELFDAIEAQLAFSFKDYSVSRVKVIPECMKLKLSDPRTRKKFEQYTGTTAKRTTRTESDFIATNEKRTLFIEIERTGRITTKHAQKHFKKRLLKQYMLKHSIYYIFKEEDSVFKYAELIGEFEREASKLFERKIRFRSLYYTSLDEFMNKGTEAFIRHVQ